MKKRLVFALFLIALILISGCNKKKSTEKSLEEIRTGTEGITMNFLTNAPPATIHVEQGADERSNTFEVVLELRNKGAFPQPDEGVNGLGLNGKVYLGGFDKEILVFEPFPPSAELKDKTLEGKSTINPNGGSDLATFKGRVDVNKLNVEKYEPTLLATACYTYFTVAGPSVCIDPNPYSTVKEKKVCEVQDITLSNQGAPIAITKIDEEAFATKTQFRITIKNVGGGDAIKHGFIDKCNPYGTEKIGREDIDKVFLQSVRIRNKDLRCGPFGERNLDGSASGVTGFIRLINGEGSIICELPSSDYGGSNTAFTTPLNIVLLYGYRNTAERKITIKKETSGLGGGSGSLGEGSNDISNVNQPSPAICPDGATAC